MPIQNANIDICSIPITTDYYITSQSSDIRQLLSSFGPKISEIPSVSSEGSYTFFDNGLLKLTCYYRFKMDSYNVINQIDIWDLAHDTMNHQTFGFSSVQEVYLCIGYDEDTHNTYWLFGGKDPWGSWNKIYRYDSTGWNQTMKENIYSAVIGSLPILYNWVSVPSVIGKNGILSLAQIASDSINDGEPVSDAAATAFSDLPAECNVGEIIDELLPYEESLVDVLVKYKVKGAVTGAFDYVKLVAKKGSIPKSIEDGDKVIDINPSKKSKLVTGLDEGSKYYFVIFEKDSAGQTAQSNEKSIKTGDLPDGTIFDYTGEIQTFVAPKTGIYQLETWGAQGGDASDGTLTARGGYGAYAVGEVLLQQGDTLYINVGGQNGYGGGGKQLVEYTLQDVARTLDFSLSNCKTAQGSIGSPQNLAEWFDTSHCLVWYDVGTLLNYLPTYSNGEIIGHSCNDFGYMAIPINLEGKKLVGFRCKLKTSQAASGFAYCSTSLIRLVDDSTGYYGVQSILYTEDGSAIPTSYTDISKTISSQITPNYLYLSIYSNYALCMKDIVFICEE